MEYTMMSCQWDEQCDFPIMAKDCKSYCHVYIYNDDPTTAYMGDLYVDESIRKQGRATELKQIFTVDGSQSDQVGEFAGLEENDVA